MPTWLLIFLLTAGVLFGLKILYIATTADVVYCYLYPDVLKRLAVKLRTELKPGAMVVSGNFPLPGWRPSEVLTCARPLYNSPLYIYRKIHTTPQGQQQA